MNLNKPKVTKAQVVLESYVKGLLKDCPLTELNDEVLEKAIIENEKHPLKKETSREIKIKNRTLNTPAEKSTPTSEQKTIENNSQTVEFKEQDEVDPRLEGVEKLLSKISLASVAKVVSQTKEEDQLKSLAVPSQEAEFTTTSKVKAPDVEATTTTEITPEIAQASFAIRKKEPLRNTLGDVFQTLVFEVSKLPLAVPLVKLGGIVNLDEKNITPLVGTPEWFMGLLPHERGNLMVVDTQKFLMPEQAHDNDKPYEYLIILDDSLWALACHTVGDAKNLSPEDIRWSAGSSQRPWFAGMVVEYMSALVEVDKLINMLAENIVD